MNETLHDRQTEQPTPRSQPAPQRRSPVRTALGRSFGKWIAIAAVGLLGLAAAVPMARFAWRQFDFGGETTIDRTGPALLEAMSDLHTYQAASGRFQVVVDVEKDAKWLPDAVRGERVVLQAEGAVDAGVSFEELDARSIVTDPATKTTTITLPHATFGPARVDLTKSKVISHKRGILDRLGSTFGDAPATDREVYKLAEKKIAAAAAESDLLRRAEQNTATMLQGLAKGLGHDNVKVVFADPKAPVTSAVPSPSQRDL